MNPAPAPAPGPPPAVALACGGTGGHVFPGLAVAGELARRGAAVTVFVSGKDVDRRAVAGFAAGRVVTVPAVGLGGRNILAFLAGFLRAWRAARGAFRGALPAAVVGFGGFTAAPVLLAAGRRRTARVLHEANAVPGRANRWLAPRCDLAAVYFPAAAVGLKASATVVTGMPVRPGFTRREPSFCRRELGLDPAAPTLLVTGGSQGARGLNRAVLAALPRLRAAVPDVQVIHLTGPEDEAAARHAYAGYGIPALVRGFLDRMELALGAADCAVARAGASSLAELAATAVPALLVPLPTAADDHQRANAAAVAADGGVRVAEQDALTPEAFVRETAPLLTDPAARDRLRAGLRRWHRPEAARDLAQRVLALAAARRGAPAPAAAPLAVPTAA
jgi:UDP-N-acetylglucosamine--N-acetylmuramyl-(pentapeptide) pyrophosphoryl-undecaprenol N-acetylglucosamine transferase